MTTSDINEQIQQFSYQYDKLGNITEEIRTEQDAINTRTYEYDSANQLIEFADNDYVEKYAYDSVGNMLSKDVNSILTEYTYNEGNQLINELTNGTEIGYTYNSNGDLVEKSTGEQYTYDIQGNLTSIVGNGIDQSFTYNGIGNRLSKTVDGETTYFVNDLNQRYEQVVQTYDNNGNVIDTYTYGLQRIDSTGQTNETYLYDGRGSVVGSVNNDNEFVSYSYTAYGELMPKSPQPTVFGYNAEATDFETGMQYLRARYYDTGVQRFVQEDAWRGNYSYPRSMNRYGYTYNNPVMYADDGGNRPVELTEVNTHTMQQVKKTTKAGLEREAQAKRDAAKAKEIQDYYMNGWNAATPWLDNTSDDTQVVDNNGVPSSSNQQNAGDNYGNNNCDIGSPYTFEELDAKISDSMDFSNYSYDELLDMYTAIMTIKVSSDSAYTNVFSKVTFQINLMDELAGRKNQQKNTEIMDMYMQMQYDKSAAGWTDETYEILGEFFDSDTNTTTTTETYADGYLYSTDTKTWGFSEWNYRFNGKQSINSDKNLGLFGVFGKAGIGQVKQNDGIDFYGEGGEGDITLSRNNVFDALVVKGQAGLGANKDSAGLLIEAKAAVFADRETIKLEIFDWEVEAGVTFDVLSAGAKYQAGYFDGEFKFGFVPPSAGCNIGYLLRIKPPQYESEGN